MLTTRSLHTLPLPLVTWKQESLRPQPVTQRHEVRLAREGVTAGRLDSKSYW